MEPKAQRQILPLHLQEVLIFESDRILQVNGYGKQKQFVSDDYYREYRATTHFMVDVRLITKRIVVVGMRGESTIEPSVWLAT